MKGRCKFSNRCGIYDPQGVICNEEGGSGCGKKRFLNAKRRNIELLLLWPALLVIFVLGFVFYVLGSTNDSKKKKRIKHEA